MPKFFQPSHFFLLSFILLLLTGSIAGILYSKELITSAVSLKAWFGAHWSSGALPVTTAWLLLWASWACPLVLGRYKVSSSSRKLMCLFPKTSDSGSFWAAVRACFSARLRKKMYSVHLFSTKVRHV